MRRVQGYVLATAMAFLGGCTSTPDVSAEDAMLAAAYRSYANGPEQLSTSSGRATRNGDSLTLRFANGQSQTLQDRSCDNDDQSTDECQRFTMLADLPRRHFYLVVEGFYEGADFLLIDDRTGRTTVIGAVPIFSPDGNYFLVQNDDEMNDHDNNLEIWRRDGDGAVLEWAHSVEQLSTEVAWPYGLYHTEVTSWRGDNIAIAFSEDDKKWTGSLTHQPTGWHLQADWPGVRDNASSAHP